MTIRLSYIFPKEATLLHVVKSKYQMKNIDVLDFKLINFKFFNMFMCETE